jgi:hypothetical protein
MSVNDFFAYLFPCFIPESSIPPCEKIYNTIAIAVRMGTLFLPSIQKPLSHRDKPPITKSLRINIK